MLLIKEKIKKLVNRYGTRDPIRLARELDIQIIYSELGNISGYCFYSNRIRCICVNSSVPDHHVPFIVAHELGHIFLHPNRNVPYLHHYTHTNVDRIEREANTFAVELLVPDECINFCKINISHQRISSHTNRLHYSNIAFSFLYLIPDVVY